MFATNGDLKKKFHCFGYSPQSMIYWVSIKSVLVSRYLGIQMGTFNSKFDHR